MTTRYEAARTGGNSSFGNEKRPDDIQGDKGANAKKVGEKGASGERPGHREDENESSDQLSEQGGGSEPTDH